MSENQALIDAGMEVTDAADCDGSACRGVFPCRCARCCSCSRVSLRRQGRRTGVLLEHRRFRAAYDLLVLRLELGEVTPELVDWWTKIQTLSPEEQQKEFGGQQQARERGGITRTAPAATPPVWLLKEPAVPAQAWVPAYIGLGSNLDDPLAHVRRALAELAALPDTRLVVRSRLYRNPPLCGRPSLTTSMQWRQF